MTQQQATELAGKVKNSLPVPNVVVTPRFTNGQWLVVVYNLPSKT